MKRHTHHLHERRTILPAGRNPMSKRRSTRMGLNAAVGVTGEDARQGAFTIKAKATNLNKHGAAVHLHRELPVGSTIVVRNQRGAEVSARVVARISAIDGLRTYGIEFVEHDDRSRHFWGISFPNA